MISGVSSLTATELLARHGAVMPRPAPPGVPPAPFATSTDKTDFASTVKYTAQDWSQMGKKLGCIAAASAISAYIPMQLVMLVPIGAIAAVGPVALIGGLVVAALEERYIGVGKRVGGLVGGALGVLGGTVKGAWHKIDPPTASPEKIQLEKRAPAGAPRKEPLAPRLLHSLERKLGHTPGPSQAADIGEAVGATLFTLATAYTLPAMIGNAVGGPIGMAMGTLAGPLTGMIVGGAIENVFGVGRVAGELVGRGVEKLRGKKPAYGLPGQSSADAFAQAGDRLAHGRRSIGDVLTKAFLGLNHIIAEPIMPYLIDGSLMFNKLFSEKPVQSMEFVDRPSPTVDRQRVADNFIKLAGISGASDHEEQISKEIGSQLDALGISYVRKPDHTIIATVPGTVKDAPTVVLSAHMDTVSPTSPEAIRTDGRRIFTNGRSILGADDRAGCAEILEGVQRIVEMGVDHPELKLVFDVCEEGGLKGASRLTADDISLRPALGFVMDALGPADINLTNDAVYVNTSSVKYAFSQEDPVVQVSMRAMADAGLEPRPMHVPIMAGAGSDANTAAFNNSRIRSIALGAGERDLHSPLENIKIDDLEQSARHVVAIIQNSCDLKVDGDAIVPRHPLT